MLWLEQASVRRLPAVAPHVTSDVVRQGDNEGIIPVLAMTVSEVQAEVARGAIRPSVRTKFQVVALLVREERARVKADATTTEAFKATQLKRLDGVATILARTAARDTSLLALIADDSELSESGRRLRRELLESAGVEVAPEEAEPARVEAAAPAKRQVVPRSVISRQLANPFLAPDLSAARPAEVRPQRLAGWELLGPLLRSFEDAGTGATSCMPLPEPSAARVPDGLELMPHQAQVVAAAAAGHRTFLLADEPGLGKTAQALLAAQAADAYPLLVVVPNVVKTNWAREVELWTPRRSATVIHGDGDTIDGFADIVIVNYEVLDRHVGWLGDLGFRGMVVDEAHFIKNKSSQRSQHVLELSQRIRTRIGRPLLMALTGTPADQRHRGLPGDLAVPRLDRRDQAPRRADGRARGHRADPRRPRLLPDGPAMRDRHGHRAPPQDRRRRRHPRPPRGRPAGRARRRGRPLDPRGRARPRPAAWSAATTTPCSGGPPAPSSRASTTTWCAGSRPGSARTPRRPRPARTCSR